MGAKELLDDAEAQLSQFNDLDDLLANYGAAEIKAWASNGGSDGPSFNLPPDLSARKIAREHARERVAAARGAHDVLTKELAAAKNVLIGAERKVSVAAQSVMIEDAEPLSKQLQEARELVWRLGDRLHGLAGLWVPSLEGRPKVVPVPPNIVARLVNDQRPMRAINAPRPEEGETQRWQSYYAALCADADASL